MPNSLFTSDLVSAPNASLPHFSELHLSYRLLKKLGTGCSGTVYRAERQHDGLNVAIKVVDKKRLDVQTAQLLRNELEILQVVSEHPGIVTLLDSIETSRYMFFILDYVDGGPLLDRIISHGNFSENDARLLMTSILHTLDYLSQLGCVHRDVKPENILVDKFSSSWPLKLTDFGLSAKMQPDELLYGALGTPLFVAPEVLKGKGYDCACDMWSLGVVLYLVLCGYPPFPYEDAEGLVKAIVNGEFGFPDEEWKHVSGDAKDVLRRMMEIDAKRRITPKQALEHPWFKVSQSTGVLNNRGLVRFNAKRKLKASVFAVGTIFEFVRSIGTRGGGKLMKDTKKESRSQQELIEEVERTRQVIREMNVRENARVSADRILHLNSKADEVSRKNEMSKTEMARKSLVFARDIMTRSKDGLDTGDESKAEEIRKRAWISQLMSSKAKKLIDEVKDGDEEDRQGVNPFMKKRDTVKAPTEDGAQGEMANRFRRPLPTLDFGGLSIT